MKRIVLGAVVAALALSSQAQAGLFGNNCCCDDPHSNPGYIAGATLRCFFFGPDPDRPQDHRYCPRESEKDTGSVEEVEVNLHRAQEIIKGEMEGYKAFHPQMEHYRPFVSIAEFREMFDSPALQEIVLYGQSSHSNRLFNLHTVFRPLPSIQGEQVQVIWKNGYPRNVSLGELYKEYAWADRNGELHPFGVRID